MPKRRIVVTYDYVTDGVLAFQVLRYEPKGFSQRRPDGKGGWIYNLQGVEPVLYHHDEVCAPPRDAWIHLCAGEKDADRLRSLDRIATTAPMGEGNWRSSYTDTLRGRKVAVYVDNDPSGRRHAQRIAPLLHAAGCTIKVVELPRLPEKGDVSDWLDMGHSVDELLAFIEALPIWEPTDEPPPDAPPSGPVLITADELMRKEFPELRWAVEGVLPEGLTLLVGAPKLGKSWLGLNIATAIAHGGRAIGQVDVDAGDVLYLALEDTQRRLQSRLGTTLQGGAAPARLTLATEWPTLADGGVDVIAEWLADHLDARLVIIDTFQKIRGPVPSNQNLYAADYAAAGELKRLADTYGVAVVLVHHTRKASAEDPLDTVSGTNGLAAAADTICVLRREIGRADASLYVRGRDVPEADHAVNFDAQSCTWNLLGDAGEYRLSQERQAVIDLLTASAEPLSPKAVADALDKPRGSVRKLLPDMVRDGQILGAAGKYHAIRPAHTEEVAS